jgi:hypothetical protein
MVEVTPDVMYCSGKNLVKGGIEETESMMDRLTEALEDVANVGAQRQGIQPRDSQWHLPSRNSLLSVTSFEKAHEIADDLDTQCTTVIDYMKSAYMELLFAAG